MVLVNGLTIDDINAALIALQRGQGEVVGGVKNTTVQNISINNSGGSGGPDFTPQIIALQDKAEELDERVETLEGKQEETDESIEQLTERLNNVGVRQLVWYEPSRQLTIVNADNSQVFAIIPSETVTLNLEGNNLVFTMGVNENSAPQVLTVELPFIPTSEKGVAGGVATLDTNGRVPYSQLPESAMEYKGKWDASTNTPHLEDGVGTNGDFYVCSAPGTVTFGTGNTVSFVVNDRVIYDGTDDMWEKLPAGAVSSVNGQTGDVTLDANDIDYSSTKTVKQAIDDIQPVQADWEESDSTDPSYIRNKIPIWITSGSASDNMAPVNSVTSGEMRPVTSNAVYDSLQNVGADIDVYDTVADAEADLSNHEVGDFIATEEGGSFEVVDAVVDGNMKAVTSNAVYDALSGKQNQLYTYNSSFTLTTSQLTSYGYVSTSIPTTITNNNILAVYVNTGNVSASNGFQLTPIFAGSGLLYFNYYRPAAFAQASITFYFRVTYFSDS